MEVVKMKKFFVLAVAMLMAGSVFAATSTVKNNIVATAAFAGEASFSFVLHEVDGDAVATTLDWTSADAFNMGSTTTWVSADQYAVVAATVTKAGYAVYMNTNKRSQWPALPEGNVKAGLVRVSADGSALGSEFNADYRGYIPVIFSYVPTKQMPTLNVAADGSVTETFDNNQSDRYLSDVEASDYSKNYTTIAALNGPTFFISAKVNGVNTDVQYPSAAVQNNTAYMYFFGGFKDIIGGDKYMATINVIEEVE